MGSMMKELLLIFSIVMVSSAIYIPPDQLDAHEDVPLEECFVERGGVKRPSPDPFLCKNTYADVPCAYLYPVLDPSSHEDPKLDYVVSDRCYKGQLSEYASNCRSQCALCCEAPEFNCTDVADLGKCDVISQLGLCEHPEMYDWVRFFCRGTCGLCLEPEFNKTICQDQFDFCPDLFGIVPCTVPFMYNNCKGTCFLLDDQCFERIPPPYPGPNDDGPVRRGDDNNAPTGPPQPAPPEPTGPPGPLFDEPTVGPARLSAAE